MLLLQTEESKSGFSYNEVQKTEFCNPRWISMFTQKVHLVLQVSRKFFSLLYFPWKKCFPSTAFVPLKYKVISAIFFYFCSYSSLTFKAFL